MEQETKYGNRIVIKNYWKNYNAADEIHRQQLLGAEISQWSVFTYTITKVGEMYKDDSGTNCCKVEISETYEGHEEKKYEGRVEFNGDVDTAYFMGRDGTTWGPVIYK